MNIRHHGGAVLLLWAVTSHLFALNCCQGVTTISGVSQPEGMAVDHLNGRVYLVDAVAKLLDVYDVNGNPITSFGTWSGGGFGQPNDVGVDAQGNVYVTDTIAVQVLIFDKQLNYLGAFGTNAVSYPRGLWVDPQGTNVSIYVSGQNNLICRYDGSGISFSGSATFGAGLNTPTGLVKRGAFVYVADTLNGHVVKYDTGNNYSAAATFTGFSFPYNVKTDLAGNLYVEDSGSAQVVDEYPGDPTGSPQVCPVPGSLLGMVVTASDKIFVSQCFSSAVTVIQGCIAQPAPTPVYSGNNPPTSGNFFIYPSPAGGDHATVSYNMQETGSVDLRVWNDKGELATRVSDTKSAGVQVTPFSLNGFSSGVYFYSLTLTYASGKVEKLGPQKFVVLR